MHEKNGQKNVPCVDLEYGKIENPFIQKST
jgi:hypothetical protein